MKDGYLLVWTRGGDRRVPLYYVETETGWRCSEDREKGFVFPSRKKAIDTWLSLHVNPESYKHCIDSGAVRAEHVRQPMLCL